MNKLISKIVGVALGLTLAVGTGVAVIANNMSTSKADAATELFYELAPASTGGNSSPHNSYTAAATTTIDGIGWSVTGNSNMVPWRIGGKSITGVDRDVHSQTAMGSAISKVELTLGAASSCTVNSVKLSVGSAESGTNIDVVTKNSGTLYNTTLTFVPTSGDEWTTGAYYTFTLNVTVSSTSNKFVVFSGAKFFRNTSEPIVTIDKETAKIKTTGTVELTATAENGSGSVAWSSSDSSIASVAPASGNTTTVTGVSAGTATITATYSGKTDTCTVTVFPVSHAGSATDPYTVSEALDLIGSDSNDETALVYVSGIISAIKSVDTTQYYNAEFSISADGEATNQLTAFRLKYLNNSNFTSADQINVGDQVVLYGKLVLYSATKEITSGYIYSQVKQGTEPGAAAITFGSASGSVAIDAASVTGQDSLFNEWTITVDIADEYFGQNSAYSQVGSSNKPATSILLEMSFDKAYTIESFEAKLGGFSGTAGDISLKVGSTEVATGELNAANDVVVSSSSSQSGSSLSVEITNIAKGVKVYYINYKVAIESLSAAEYASEFLSVLSTGASAVCDSNGETNLASLKAAWKSLADLFSGMTNTDKALFTNGTAGSSTDIEKALALYDYIATKYNTNLESSSLASYNFMGRNITPAPAARLSILGANNSVLAITIIAICVVSASSAALYFFLRKKKEN